MSEQKKLTAVSVSHPHMRDKLKSKLKEILRKKMKEISTSSAAGGGNGDGSAGPVKTPNWGGQVKDPTIGLDGYKKIGKDETGTLNEKDKPKAKDGDNKDGTKKPASAEPTPYQPIIAPDKKDGATDKKTKLKDLEQGLAQVHKLVQGLRKRGEKKDGAPEAESPKK